MDLSYGPEHERYRADVQAFLIEAWRPQEQGMVRCSGGGAENRSNSVKTLAPA